MQISEAVVAGRALLLLYLGTISKAVDIMLAVSASLLLLASCKQGACHETCVLGSSFVGSMNLLPAPISEMALWMQPAL